MRTPRIYVDTSVLGGCFDDVFCEPTDRLFKAHARGEWTAVISDVTVDELEGAPAEVRDFAMNLPTPAVEWVRVD